MVRARALRTPTAEVQVEPMTKPTPVDHPGLNEDLEDQQQPTEAEALEAESVEEGSGRGTESPSMVVAIPDQWGEGELSGELIEDAAGDVSPPLQSDSVGELHHINSILAQMLLDLPVGQMRRTLNSAMGPEVATRWLGRLDAYRQQHQEFSNQIVQQVLRGSLGRSKK